MSDTSLSAVPVILDCDPGVDDTMALFYGLLAPEVDIVAIGTIWGNVSVEAATRNTLTLLEIADRPDIPVAEGAARPLVGPDPERPTFIHGQDGQGNINLPPPSREPTGERAAEQIVRLAREHPGELTLVAVGPLTNVALALALDPETAHRLAGIVIMGGTVRAPGNVGRTAEANIGNDPEAAQMVFESGAEITLIGLDVTEQARVTQEMLDRLEELGTPMSTHMARICGPYLDTYEGRYGKREAAMHDALALGIACDPTLVREARRARVDVELTGTHTRGMTVVDLRSWASPDDVNASVVLEADAERYVERWNRILSGV